MKSKKVAKPVFFVVLILILALTYTAFFGIDDYYGDTRNIYIKSANDIRWGIDISGGVEAVFSPADTNRDISASDMDAAEALINQRLLEQSITDADVYADGANHQIIVRFPWDANESDFDAVATVKKLGASAMLIFREGTEETGNVILQGSDDVKSASVGVDKDNKYVVQLQFTSQGTTKFSEATARMVGSQISIWLSETDVTESGSTPHQTLLSAPKVNEAINQDSCVIEGEFTADEVNDLVNKINSGKLPFALTVDNSKLQIISPSLGSNALHVMLIAGSIAFGVICLLMIIRYRLHGVIAAFALLGQLAGTIACISGFFPGVSSFTLTIPGIAGIILSIGVGVDCNVIAAERIRDEFKKGKTIDGAIDSGFKNSLSAIIDGNVTIVIVALVLMGAFGNPDNPLAKLLSFLGSSITGSIYSFGYTLLVGVIFNLIMGVLASKWMLKSISRYKIFRNPALYGGKKNVE